LRRLRLALTLPARRLRLRARIVAGKFRRDLRILRLTREQEKSCSPPGTTQRPRRPAPSARSHARQLGLRVEVAPGFHEVRTMLGIEIQIEALPGCAARRAKRFRRPFVEA
jgi:hypothetical protein